jgi:DNA-directed RNA polymerase specialized sigma24 family protein
MSPHNNVRDAMLAAVPSLRVFAISLFGNVDRADDLVQEALLRALTNLGSLAGYQHVRLAVDDPAQRVPL